MRRREREAVGGVPLDVPATGLGALTGGALTERHEEIVRLMIAQPTPFWSDRNRKYRRLSWALVETRQALQWREQQVAEIEAMFRKVGM